MHVRRPLAPTVALIATGALAAEAFHTSRDDLTVAVPEIPEEEQVHELPSDPGPMVTLSRRDALDTAGARIADDVSVGMSIRQGYTLPQPEFTPTVITGSFSSVIPLIVAFILLQRFWRAGLAVGSMK